MIKNEPPCFLGRTFRKRFLTLCLLGGLSLNTHAQSLPELNDSASLIINSAEEALIGKQVMLNIRAQTPFSQDALLIDYLDTLTNNLAKHSPRPLGQLTLGLAIDPVINAFAVPGGYININTGLIEHANNEDELAAVISHEIGHHSQRHIARSIERSKQLTLPATAALIGGILLGGQAGAAAILSSQAAVASDRLSYSRTFEIEADASGMIILAAAGYQPKAMPAFFSELEKQAQLYGGEIPEFLRTHPISSDRIADGIDRASRLQVTKPKAEPAQDQLDYVHAKARIRALYTVNANVTAANFKQLIKNANSDQQGQSARYGLSLLQIERRDFNHATQNLDLLLATNTHTPLYFEAKASLALAAGETESAMRQYQRLYDQDKNNQAFAKGLASAAFMNNNNALAVRVLRKSLRRFPDRLWAYEQLAQIYGEEGKTLNALFIKAQKLNRLGQYGKALALLEGKTSRQFSDQSSYLLASIDAFIAQTRTSKANLENFEL